jgi:hypothetical protein
MENILEISLNCLTDDVFAIRDAGCKLLKQLYNQLKGFDFEKVLLEKLSDMKNNSSYLIRNTILFLARVII